MGSSYTDFSYVCPGGLGGHRQSYWRDIQGKNLWNLSHDFCPRPFNIWKKQASTPAECDTSGKPRASVINRWYLILKLFIRGPVRLLCRCLPSPTGLKLNYFKCRRRIWQTK